jgi:group I intron endonuclease
MTCGIYSLTFSNGKVYIGSSVDTERRRGDHKAALRKGTHPNPYLQNCWNKYREFEFKVLEECLTQELASKEIYWISTYSKELLVNSATVINDHFTHSEEVKKKISQARMGNPSRIGMHNTEEANRKIALAKMGNLSRTGMHNNPCSEETKKKISEANKGGKSRTGQTRSKEERQKQSETWAGKKLKGWVSKKHSEEAKRKISEAKKVYWQKRKGSQ